MHICLPYLWAIETQFWVQGGLSSQFILNGAEESKTTNMGKNLVCHLRFLWALKSSVFFCVIISSPS